MDSRESSRSYTKRDIEDGKDTRGDRVADNDDLNGSAKRKCRSNKTRKNNNVEEVEDNIERRKSSGDRIESRKRHGSSTRADSGDDDVYVTSKESRPKQVKKSQDDKAEKKQSSSYQERDAESHISGSKVHGIADESDRESSRRSANPSFQQTAQDLVIAICKDPSLMAQLRKHILSTLRPDEIAAAVAKIAQPQASNVQDQ